MINVGCLHYPNWFASGDPSSFVLDAAEEHGAFVLTIPKTGTLLKVGWRLASVSSPVLTLKLSLETVLDAIGAPVATSDAGKTLYAAGAQSAAIADPAAGVRFDAINGASPGTGISVTKGDLAAVAIRCTARASGSVNVAYDQYATISMGARQHSGQQIPYWYTYLGGAGAVGAGESVLTLEYDTGMVVLPHSYPASLGGTADTWNSGSNPDRRGLKMTFPFGCTLRGADLYLDTDEDVQILLYDADEYTVMAGFPITLQGTTRRANAAGAHYVEFPTEPTLLAGSAYRLVVLPATETNISGRYWVPADDGAVLGMTALMGGSDFCYTTFNGEPSSGSHAWSDTTTRRPGILPVLSQLDFPTDAEIAAAMWAYGNRTLTA